MTEPVKCPFAVWKPLTSHNYRPGTLAQRKKIALHITQGPTAQSAINWFNNPASQVSAHFVIDRDGTTYQLLSISDSAWHVQAANSYTVGIEHAAIAGKLMATEAQYSASSMLIAYLCKLLELPCNRNTVQSHYELNKSSNHTKCCTGALDPDRVVAMAAKITPGVAA